MFNPHNMISDQLGAHGADWAVRPALARVVVATLTSLRVIKTDPCKRSGGLPGGGNR